MGAAIMPNLVKSGHEVRVWNRTPDAAKTLEGITVLASPAEAFESEAVITVLADDPAVRSVLINSGALRSAPKAQSIS